MDRNDDGGLCGLDPAASSAAGDFDAERAVLACLLLAPGRFKEIAIAISQTLATGGVFYRSTLNLQITDPFQ